MTDIEKAATTTDSVHDTLAYYTAHVRQSHILTRKNIFLNVYKYSTVSALNTYTSYLPPR